MPTPTTFAELVNGLAEIFNLLIYAIVGVVFVVLVWKIFDAWVISAGDEKKRADGKQMAIVAVVVMVIMFTIWGIVGLLRRGIFGV